MTRELAPCGTRAAYRRHLRHYEKPCTACAEAAAEYVRDRRRRADLAALTSAENQAPPEPTTGGTA